MFHDVYCPVCSKRLDYLRKRGDRLQTLSFILEVRDVQAAEAYHSAVYLQIYYDYLAGLD
jgi:hypothetical protein